MPKFAPLLFVVAAAVVAAIFIFGGDESDDLTLEDTEGFEDEEFAAKLRTSEAARRAVEAAKRAKTAG